MTKTVADTQEQGKSAHSKKKTHASVQTDEKKEQQEKKTRASAQTDEKQKRKEQAKHEAKLMLKAERAKKDVQKAEQKLAKAQTRLEDARTQQHTLEQKLAALRTPQQAEVSHNGIPAASDKPLTTLAPAADTPTTHETPLPLTTPFIMQSADTTGTTEVPTTSLAEAQDTTAPSALTGNSTVATDLESEQPPAEGRTDIPAPSEEQSTPTSVAAGGEEPQSAQTHATDSADFQIGSDNATMPLLSHDEHTWPPPLIREEVAAAAQEVEASDAHAAQEASAHEEETHTSSSLE
ncbi:MAG: hypothetical protein NVSMB54_15620 [Ktedonobacteraceae bacterium]